MSLHTSTQRRSRGHPRRPIDKDGRLTSKGEPRACRVCGCTDRDCRQCIAKTGRPCYWVDVDLCSACVDASELPRAA